MAIPAAIIVAGIFLLYNSFSSAGQIRRLELSEDHPGTVVLALGRTTAISFASRPEKVVPGSPQALQINFLGSDLTVTPVSRKPGNLLVYTKSGRYVILFRIGSDSDYDDVVKIGALGRGRPVHLLTDSFRPVAFHVEAKAKVTGKPLAVADAVTLPHGAYHGFTKCLPAALHDSRSDDKECVVWISLHIREYSSRTIEPARRDDHTALDE